MDSSLGSRNGHGKPRRLSLMSGTVEVRRPRVRGLEERFESRILLLFMRRTQAVTELLPELYVHGLSQGLIPLYIQDRSVVFWRLSVSPRSERRRPFPQR